MRIAHDLMDKHGLAGWFFHLDNARRRFGRCTFTTRTISISLPLARLNSEQHVVDTILHEIAHAKAGRDAGHGPEWRRAALSVGAKAERCYGDDVVTPKKKYKGVCPTCGYEVCRHRRITVSCSKCSGGRFNEAHRIVWSLN